MLIEINQSIQQGACGASLRVDGKVVGSYSGDRCYKLIVVQECSGAWLPALLATSLGPVVFGSKSPAWAQAQFGAFPWQCCKVGTTRESGAYQEVWVNGIRYGRQAESRRTHMNVQVSGRTVGSLTIERAAVTEAAGVYLPALMKALAAGPLKAWKPVHQEAARAAGLGAEWAEEVYRYLD